MSEDLSHPILLSFKLTVELTRVVGQAQVVSLSLSSLLNSSSFHKCLGLPPGFVVITHSGACWCTAVIEAVIGRHSHCVLIQTVGNIPDTFPVRSVQACTASLFFFFNILMRGLESFTEEKKTKILRCSLSFNVSHEVNVSSFSYRTF